MIKKLFVVVSLFLIAACSSDKDNSEPPAELVEFKPTAKVKKLWDVSVGVGVEQQYLKLYPLVLNDRIIMADREGEVIAVNLKNGNEIWEIELDAVLSGGVGGDASNHLVTTRDGEVINIDHDGKIKWRKSASSEVLVPPMISKDKVIIRSVDGQIIALSLSDGELLWNYKRDVPALTLRGNSQSIIEGGRIYTGLDNGRLVILDSEDGQTLFDVAVAVPTGRTELERIVDIDGESKLINGILYIGSYQGRVVAIDVRRGQLIWARNLSTSTGVEVTGAALFSSDAQDHLWALDSNNGATLWKQEKLKARQLTKPVAMGDWVVVGDYDGYLHWLSQYDGHFVARVRVDSSGILVPPIVRDDHLYVISREGEMAAYRIMLN